MLRKLEKSKRQKDETGKLYLSIMSDKKEAADKLKTETKRNEKIVAN